MDLRIAGSNPVAHPKFFGLYPERRDIIHSGQMKEVKLSRPFIVVEGLDGTGKSTVTKLIADKIGGIRVATPMEPYQGRRPKYVEATFNPQDSFEFYLEATLHAAWQIAQMCKTQAVVCDRYIASTFSYHTGLGLDSEYASKRIEETDLIFPSISFLLDARNEVLTDRLTRRGSRPLSLEALSRIRTAYLRFNFVHVDTSDIDQDTVCNKIVEILQQKGLVS